MIKYYTRACNFKYGPTAKQLINSKKALPLCGNKNISFDEGFCLLEKSEDLIDDFLHGRKSFMKEMKVKIT